MVVAASRAADRSRHVCEYGSCGYTFVAGAGIFVKYSDLDADAVGAPVWKLYDQIVEDGTFITYQVR